MNKLLSVFLLCAIGVQPSFAGPVAANSTLRTPCGSQFQLTPCCQRAIGGAFSPRRSTVTAK